ncbi:MAG: Ig-like domain-containing protein [Gemmatimonadaceae bacterium]
MRRLLLLIAPAMLAACASPGVPPGGPVDTEAPKVLRIVPDSGRAGTTPKEVIFRFDEVVSERPAGVASLEALFLISPRDGSPRVDWHRDEISVRPRRNWRSNTAYTVTLLPGISDLRGNVRNTGTVTLFSTGATIPKSRLKGTLFNWAESRAINRSGFIEARRLDDTTLVYVAATDSLGTYVFPNLSPGSYQIRGIGDDNGNRGLDPRESWDSVSVSLADSATVDLYAFVHDSVGARLVSASLRDSVTIELSFDSPLSPSTAVGPTNIRVRSADSTDVGILTVAAPPPDTTATSRRMKRPAPTRTLLVKVSRQLRPGTSYRVTANGVTSLSGIARSTETILTVPAAPPPSPVVTPKNVPVVPPPIKR